MGSLTTDQCAAAGSGRLPMLMVVDVQNGFITPSSAHVVPVVARLVDRWSQTDAPVVFTRYFNYRGSPFERLVGWSGLMDAPDTDIVAELEHRSRGPRTHLLDKTTYTAFTAEAADLIATLGVTDVHLCGIATDACILKTALDLFEAGLTPWVITDACASNASRHPPQQVHDSALMHMSRLLGAGQLIDSVQALSVIGILAA
ncbi:cysteine hydrolase [Nocardia sp. NBC_00881]|uniref:isochorismatase family cysteine hydrolase n=1 Tax=Nocardia sp. NBC_00881 TaxID=2975995 RepID=UPI003866D49E|nr:cysteine hydrolase [Nocardia sp. NBC_00881]